MTDPTPATVAVPVELLERFKLDNHARVLTAAEKELVTLLPKPTPRLVAVDLHADHPGPLYLDELRDKPDLLTLLDEVLERSRGVIENLDDPTKYVQILKSRIRAALGVGE